VNFAAECISFDCSAGGAPAEHGYIAMQSILHSAQKKIRNLPISKVQRHMKAERTPTGDRHGDADLCSEAKDDWPRI
jgi:hypothetical protein